jgi:hypothetical protein
VSSTATALNLSPSEMQFDPSRSGDHGVLTPMDDLARMWALVPRQFRGRITRVAVLSQVASKALEVLETFRELPADWDSYGALPITATALRQATEFLTAFQESPRVDRSSLEVVPYVISPLPNGGVQIEWRKRSGSLEIEIQPDGSFAALVEHVSDSPRYSESDRLSLRQALALLETFVGG